MTAPQYDDALTYLRALLAQWGLESLDGDVSQMLLNGDSADVIPLKIRDTEAYKKRFAGNLERIRNGLPALSEGEYLSTETALKDVVRRYVGAGTYDTRENLQKWIASDVAPQELNERMTGYRDNFMVQPDWVKDAWAARGYTPADAIKAVIDPTVTETTLRRQLGSYSLGSEALQAYKDPNALDMNRLGRLADAGVTSEQARKGYGQVAAREQREGMLASFGGETLTRTEQEDAALLGDEAVDLKRRRVLDLEQARFGENYLGTTSAFKRDRSGAY
jgi:hypothetical protein